MSSSGTCNQGQISLLGEKVHIIISFYWQSHHKPRWPPTYELSLSGRKEIHFWIWKSVWSVIKSYKHNLAERIFYTLIFTSVHGVWEGNLPGKIASHRPSRTVWTSPGSEMISNKTLHSQVLVDVFVWTSPCFEVISIKTMRWQVGSPSGMHHVAGGASGLGNQKSAEWCCWKR